MASPPSPTQPASGYRASDTFEPKDDELVSVYLRRRVDGEQLPAGTARFFHGADICATDPATLVRGYLPAPSPRKGETMRWYFFSPLRSTDERESRTVGDGLGAWCSYGNRPKEVFDGEGCLVGNKKSFYYAPQNGDDSGSGWRMVEFRLGQKDDKGSRSKEEDDEGGGVESETVLCKMHENPPGIIPSASNSQSSGSSRKRDSSGEASSPPVRRRRRLALDPPAPIPPAVMHALESIEKHLMSDDYEPEADESHAQNAILESLEKLLMPDEPEAEAEEPLGETSTLDHGSFMADLVALQPCVPGADASSSWTGGHTMEPSLSDVEFAAGLPARSTPPPEDDKPLDSCKRRSKGAASP